MIITLVIHVDLRNGRGSEKVLLNILKYKPENIQIKIIETDYIENQRISDEEINDYLKNVDLIKIHRNVIGKKMDSVFKIILNNIIFRSYYKDIKNISKDDLKNIKKTDIAYLFNNFYAILFTNSNLPVIGSNHAIDPSLFFDKNVIKRLYYLLYYKIYFKSINGYHVFPKNEYIIKKLENKFKMKYNFVLTNGVDTKIFYPDYNIKNKKLKVFFIASLTYKKGLDILLPLIDKFGNNGNIEFNIAGDGPLKKEIVKRKNIIYHGIVSENRLSELYRTSDLFVYPSKDDYYGLVVLESLSSGLFVLCSENLKGNFDDFKNKYLLYIENNVDSYYNIINNIIKNRDIINHDKILGYNYIKDNYDWEVIGKKFFDYLKNFKK